MRSSTLTYRLSEHRLPRPARSERAYHALWLSLALLLSGMLAVTLVSTGSIVAGAALVTTYLVVALTIYSIEWGYYILIFTALFFDQHNSQFIMPFTAGVNYFANINLIAGMPRYMVVSLWELHLAFVLFIWAVRVAAVRGYTTVRLPLTVPALLGAAALVLATAHGAAAGAQSEVVLWEVRALIYFGILYYWTPQVIRTRPQLNALIWVLIAGITVKALQGGYFYAGNGFSFGYWPNIVETYTNHEDPLFIVLLIMLLGLFLALGAKTKQKTALLLLLLPLLIGFISGQRRATYASGMASAVGVLFLLPKKNLLLAVKFLAVFLLLFALYAAAFWNSYSRIGYVAQQFKSTVVDEAGVRGQKDVESTRYRKAENFNLASTFRREPVIGIGFGCAYDRPLRPWGGNFPLADYIPHNQIFWIFVKTGVIGGFAFWFLFNSLVVQGSIVFRRLQDPYLKAVCAMCVISVVNQMVVSYVDMQLTFSRNMIVLGSLMGVIQVLDRWSQPAAAEAPTIHSSENEGKVPLS